MEVDDREMLRFAPWPYPDDAFPSRLGALIQGTVLDGVRPALLVAHFPDGDWAIGDGIDDPNVPGASVVTHIWHAIRQNSSIAGLAGLPLGHEARRLSPADPWVIEPVTFED